MFDMAKFLDREFKCRVSGGNLVFDCPFCLDKSLNYWFDTEKEYIHRRTKKKYKGIGRCWKCDKRHNQLSFIMEYKKKDMFEALNFIQGEKNITAKGLLQMLRELDQEPIDDIDALISEFQHHVNVEIPPGSSSKLPDELIEWFEGDGIITNDGLSITQRSFPRELLKLLEVQYCWTSHTDPTKEWNGMMLGSLRNRAIFPITTGNSRAWQAYQYRPGKNRKTGTPFAKTRNPPGPIMQSLLYLYEYAKNSKVILGNEGIFDALRTLSRGYSPVGLLGKNLSFTQAYLISKTKAHEFCMCLDGGKREYEQAVKNCLKLEEMFEGDITIMRLPDGLDPDDCPEKIFNKCYANRKSFDVLKLDTEASQLIAKYSVSRNNGVA